MDLNLLKCIMLRAPKTHQSNFYWYPLVTRPAHSCVILTPRGAYHHFNNLMINYRTNCYFVPRGTYLHLCDLKYNNADEEEVYATMIIHIQGTRDMLGQAH